MAKDELICYDNEGNALIKGDRVVCQTEEGELQGVVAYTFEDESTNDSLWVLIDLDDGRPFGFPLIDGTRCDDIKLSDG